MTAMSPYSPSIASLVRPPVPSCIAFLLFCKVGCVHTQAPTLGEPGGYASLNRRAAEHDAHVTLAGGRHLPATALQVTLDLTSWIDPASGAVMNVATPEVTAVQFTRHGRGALEELGIGLLSGAAMGALVGFASGDDDPGILAFTAEEKALLGGVFFGGIGGLLGLSFGAAIGSKDVYALGLPPTKAVR